MVKKFWLVWKSFIHKHFRFSFLQDCCYLSALQCFRSNLQVHFNILEKKQRKLYKLHKSLGSHLTVRKLLAALLSDMSVQYILMSSLQCSAFLKTHFYDLFQERSLNFCNAGSIQQENVREIVINEYMLHNLSQ